MPQPSINGPDSAASSHLIRARKGVVVTSTVDVKTGIRTYYLKVNETGEIFEFGEDEYDIWRQFEGGASLEAAGEAVAERFGGRVRDRLRGFVADLAMRGLLGGDLPPDLVAQFEQTAKANWRPYLVDPSSRPHRTPPYFARFRLVLCDPNVFFGWLARWFGWLRHLRWPLAGAAGLAVMVLLKHANYFSSDFHATILQWGRVWHSVLTLLTINLTRVVAQGAVSRYYGARVRYMSIDLVYGVWPRFHEDKKGILLLERSPQLWSHSAPFFVRLAFFSVGTLGWWMTRGNGSQLYTYFLLVSQAAIADFATATLPLFRNETYFWFCALLRDPVLQDRGTAALRRMFFISKGGAPRYLSAVEKLALTLYGLSMMMALLVILMIGVNFFIGLTGAYVGAGFVLFLTMIALGVAKVSTIRALKRKLLEARATRRVERRSIRRNLRNPAMAAAIDE